MRRSFAVLATWLSWLSPAFAVLDIDTGQTGIAKATSTVSAAALTTPTAGDILVACVGAEWIDSVGASGTVSGVANTVTPLTWAKRSSVTLHAGAGNAWNNMECWWAYSSGILTSSVVTATYTLPGGTTFDAAGIIVIAVNGFTGGTYSTSPWDQNVSLPATASTGAAGSPTLSTVSTTNAATGIIVVVGGGRSSPWLASEIGAGYTFIGAASQQTAAVNYWNSGMEVKVVSATQSSATANWVYPTAPGWLLIADALSQTGGGAAAATNKSGLTLRGVGK